jgi:hypothetical protein
MYKPLDSSKELRAEIKALKNIWSRESIITTRGVVYLCELMERLLAELPGAVRKKRRIPTVWQKFLGQGLKQGKTMKAIAEEYHNRRP